MSENGATRTPLLEFRGINTHYGAVHILKDVDLAIYPCLLYTSPSPRDRQKSRMPSSA